MSPEYVRPYVKAQKNDDRDAEAIAEASTTDANNPSFPYIWFGHVIHGRLGLRHAIGGAFAECLTATKL